MTKEDLHLVQSSWALVRPIADQAAELFYDRLFGTAPELRRLFRGDMPTQRRRLMRMIDTAVGELENLDDLVPLLQDLGRRHAGYGVRDADYDTVAGALLWTLERGLGDAFTDDVRRAWIATYTLMADTMKGAAAEAAAA